MSSDAHAAAGDGPGHGTVLVVSSAVAYGNVGIRATAAGLRAFGQRTIELPTVVLSNHPGMGPPAGIRLDAAALGAMIDALERLGQLDHARAVMTGYFAAPDQVDAVAERIARLKSRRRDLVILVDPVIGDEEDGLYVDERAAAAIRERLVPIAGIATPNVFELGWLSRRPAGSEVEVVAAARQLAVPEVLVSSVKAEGHQLKTLAITRDGVARSASPLLAEVPHGTGDLLAGLYLGCRLAGADTGTSLGEATTMLQRAIAKSVGRDVLDLEATAC
jgi:pyridoxine kinase